MRKPVLLLMLCSLLLASCHSEQKPELTAEQRAMLVAKESYEALYVGKSPQTFLDNRIGAYDMPEIYRRQLLDAYRQSADKVSRDRNGVKAVEALRAESDAGGETMQVFLMLTFGDGSKEEVVVPLVADGSHRGKWKMK